ncbi:NgoPII family restriction endonuclease, partial [Francisella tularensis subsp. holarctica]|nr:NgoPII family restriction endonuclease [Francisella tularensis subsp. holarctica]
QWINKLELICIIPLAKYQKIPDNRRKSFEKLKVVGLNVEDKKVRDPNNPAKIIDFQFVKFII